jgi:hypothetical protein
MNLIIMSFITVSVSYLCLGCNNASLKEVKKKVADSKCFCNSEYPSFHLNDSLNIGEIVKKNQPTKNSLDKITVNFNFNLHNECYCIKSEIIIPPDLKNRPVGWMKRPKGEVIYVFSKKKIIKYDTNTVSIMDITNSMKQEINDCNCLSFSSNYRTELYGIVIKSALKWILSGQNETGIKYTGNFNEFIIEFFMPDLTHSYPLKDSLY